jgi:hypothetical protein
MLAFHPPAICQAFFGHGPLNFLQRTPNDVSESKIYLPKAKQSAGWCIRYDHPAALDVWLHLTRRWLEKQLCFSIF